MSDAPVPAFHQGQQVTVWIAGLAPNRAVIRKLDQIREGEWWYICMMRGMFAGENHAAVPIPEGWITAAKPDSGTKEDNPK